MTPDELTRLKALCDAATPGPWGASKAFDQCADIARAALEAPHED